jgi:hypothetical protein
MQLQAALCCAYSMIFYNIIFNIKPKLASRTAPPPLPEGKIRGAHLRMSAMVLHWMQAIGKLDTAAFHRA